MNLSQDDFERLFVNNPELSRIESFLNRFNPLRVLGVEKLEIRHSRVLGWLLDPAENHGLGDTFLKSFLAEVLKDNSGANEDSPIAALEVIREDLGDTTVLIEWNNIDIFIRCARQKWDFIIENKIHSSLHSEQLKRYRETVENLNKGTETRVQGVLLSRNYEQPDDDNYLPASYNQVLNCLNICLDQRRDSLNERVLEFIGYYLEILEVLVGDNDEDEDMRKLAKQMYRENHKLIDFIYENGNESEFQIYIDALAPKSGEAFKPGSSFEVSNRNFVVTTAKKNALWFIPDNWATTLGRLTETKGRSDETLWGGCQTWPSYYPVACWILPIKGSRKDGTPTNHLRLLVEVGPLADFSLRKRLIKCIKNEFPAQKKGNGFTAKATKEGTKYSRFFKYDVAVGPTRRDSAEPKDVTEELFERFVGIIDPVTKALGQFMNDSSASD